MTDGVGPREPEPWETIDRSGHEIARVMRLLANLRADKSWGYKVPSMAALAKMWGVRGRNPGQLVYKAMRKFIAARRAARNPYTFVSLRRGGREDVGYYAWTVGMPLPRPVSDRIEERLDRALADASPGEQLPLVEKLADQYGPSADAIRRHYADRVTLGEVERRGELYFKPGPRATAHGRQLPGTVSDAIEATLHRALAHACPGQQLPLVQTIAQKHGVSGHTVRRRCERRRGLGEVELQDHRYVKKRSTAPPDYLAPLVADVRRQVRDLDTGDRLLGNAEMAASHHCPEAYVRQAKIWVMKIDGTCEPVGKWWRTKRPHAYPAQALADLVRPHIPSHSRNQRTPLLSPERLTEVLREIIGAHPELTVLPAASALAGGLGMPVGSRQETREAHVELAFMTLVNEGLLEYRDGALVVHRAAGSSRGN